MFMPDNTDSIAMIFNAGQDFPDDTVQMFESWSINLKIHRIIDKPSARGLVFYEESNFNSRKDISLEHTPSSNKGSRKRISALD